ncbi:hypothetical protein BJF85_10980 [Saccharomonospora sp. CUA-673]|uniref:Rossmann-like domain-containing protein n=1 Tax=Saccharomonospora sp. CUA-673 TaxID=1904969 RepID=UPI000965EB9C|nr:DUF364 domain-containing protein [Saccharomonospora sp. CUA-673]OLT48967.1 hypothetical protein BJF85_10980 [Saccharomonospora sp. CUA-673]
MSQNFPDPGRSADGALERVVAGLLPDDNPALTEATASVAFLTVQAARHTGRSSGYVNTVLSVRVGPCVGSCAVEPDEVDSSAVDSAVVREIVGSDVASLLAHPARAVRIAALDAYLAARRPHPLDSRTVRIPSGTSLEKSMARARVVADLVPLPAGGTVAVIGVVNSLLSALRERGLDYVACDLGGGRTEWDEPITDDHRAAIEGADAVLASGMTLGNGTFDDISHRCRERGIPLVMFAQTGAAVLRELLGDGTGGAGEIAALSAEPYPFFWLSGDATDVHVYGEGHGAGEGGGSA